MPVRTWCCRHRRSRDERERLALSVASREPKALWRRDGCWRRVKGDRDAGMVIGLAGRVVRGTGWVKARRRGRRSGPLTRLWRDTLLAGIGGHRGPVGRGRRFRHAAFGPGIPAVEPQTRTLAVQDHRRHPPATLAIVLARVQSPWTRAWWLWCERANVALHGVPSASTYRPSGPYRWSDPGLQPRKWAKANRAL